MNRIQAKFVEDAMEQDEKLTDWEAGFIDTLYNRDDDYELSEKENTILNRISQKLQ